MTQPKVTQEVDEIFVSRSGVIQVNPAEVRRKLESEREPQVRRDNLDDLERELSDIRARKAEREQAVQSLGPQVDAAQAKFEQAKKNLEHAEEAVKENLRGCRNLKAECEIKLQIACDSLAALSQRLDISERVLKSIKQVELEYLKLNGDRLAKLRKFAV